MSKRRSYTLVGEDAVKAQEQVAELIWFDKNPVRLGDFGHRLKMSGILFQGECHQIMVLGPNAEEGELGYCPECGVNTVHPDLETWCKIIMQTDDPVFFEQNEEGLIKAVHRKMYRQISSGVQWEIFERDGFRCMYCGRHGGSGCPLTIDHFVPLELGRQDCRENYVCSCRRCQKDKGAREPQAWMEAKGLDYEGLKLYLSGKAPVSFIAHLQ